MDLKRFDRTSERALLLVTALYSTSLIVSNSFSLKSCLRMVPIGECPTGQIDHPLEWESVSLLQRAISFVVAFLAGAWSDSHGRQRTPLLFLPIIGQIVTDCLNFMNMFWFWPSIVDVIFLSILPGLYVGQNMFWIGAMSYVSENSSVKSRTMKLGTIITTYTISSLLGSGIVAFLKLAPRFDYSIYYMFLVPVMLNTIAIWIGYYYIKDTSDVYNKNIVWLRPTCLYKGFVCLFKNKLKTFAVSLAILMVCESLFVARIGNEDPLIMNYVKGVTTWFNDDYVYFDISRMLSIIFGTMFFVALLNKQMKVSELLIGLIVCSLYIVSSVLFAIPYQYWRYFMILINDFCHGAAITITTSLTSKMVEIEELGRLNSLQTSMNTLFTLGIIVVANLFYSVMVPNFMVVNNRMINSDYITLYCIGYVIFIYVILMIPITYVFMFLYSKYKEFWGNNILETKNKSIYAVNQ